MKENSNINRPPPPKNLSKSIRVASRGKSNCSITLKHVSRDGDQRNSFSIDHQANNYYEDF
jgi:hypothetical protein